MERRSQRSIEAESYRPLYKTARWQRIRKIQLREHPLCQPCLKRGRVTAATVCHHVDPKTKASPATFYQGPYSSACAACHNSDMQSEERTGRKRQVIGYDGWPVEDA